MTAAFDEAALRHWLVDYLVTNIGCSPDEIDFDAPLTDLAVGSSDAVVLSGELSELLGRTVSPVEFWQYPTINALARFLTGVESESAAEVAGVERGSTEDLIAVIGMGCRLPGDIRGPEEYWEFLAEGRSAVGQVPPDRWAWSDDGSPEGAAALAGTTRWGSFLSDVDAFDAEYFEISPREAAKMDPQQRLLLEVTHEALENAGIPVSKVRHTQTGVFAGACVGEYGYLASADLGDVDSWSGTGGAMSIIANRVSYYFDLRGPSIAVDTACSSSLVAVHLACQSLRSGDSSLALAAGVNLLLSPAITRSFDQLEALSRSGRCHSFDARADGFVRGEGCGVVVLKRLSEAVADGDRVLAVIRGSAVNQDGRSNGLMAPNPAAQMAVLRSAYAAAGVEPREVDYVEAHGTGTLLGDPIEARALGTVLGRGRAADAPLLVGAVKSNLGHLEAAAGVAGFIKAVLALQRGRVPANLGYENPNPHIPFDNLRLKVVAEETELRSVGRPWRAGVSSFGFGGTNAHVVLEQGPVPPDVVAASAGDGVVRTLVVSGKSAARVASMAGMLASWMSGAGAGVGLAEVAHTLNHHRGRHPRFASVCARDRAGAVAGLVALAAGESAPGVVGPQGGAPRPGTVFVYSGQGSQWAGMGRRLLAEEPVFAAAVAQLEPVFLERVGFSLQQVLAGGESVQGDARVQPVLLGLQLALTELWRSRGVHPDAVIGHSMGEVSAAVVAGALSVADGLQVIAVRSRVMSRLAGQGAVALVELDAEAAAAVVAGFPSVEVAGELSPRQSVVAGLPAEVDAVIAAVSEQNRFARRVNMEVASHTALMDPVLAELGSELAGVSASVASIPFFSTVVDPTSEPVLDAGYWVDNVRRPVRFRQAVAAAAEEHGTFIEISPHPVLTNAVSDTLGAAPHRTIETLLRDADDTLTFHTNLNATHPPQTEHDAEPHVVIPTTPWHHTHHWMPAPKRPHGAVSAPRPGTLLGTHTGVAGQPPTHVWQAQLVPQGKPYPGSHRIDGLEVVPLSVLLQTLSLAAAELGASNVGDVRFERPIFVDRPQVIQVVADGHAVTVSSAPDVDTPVERWVKHAGARILGSSEDRRDRGGAVGDVPHGYDAASLSELQREWGIEGRAYPWSIETSSSTPGRLRVVVDVPDGSTVALLDAAINVGRLVDASNPGLLVPADAEHLRFAADLTDGRGVVEVRRRSGDGDQVVVDIAVTGSSGDPCLDIRGLRYVDVESRPDAGALDVDPRTAAHAIDWMPWEGLADLPNALQASDTIAVVGESASAQALRTQFAVAGYGAADADAATCILYVADPGSADTTETDLDHSVRLSKDVADLVRRLVERHDRHPATLWILTQGVREAASDAALRQSCLWGIAGVIGAEQPQLWGGLVDVSADAEIGESAAELAKVLPNAAKSILALHDGDFLASTLVPIAGQPVREPMRCHADAAYLITGGMGALGLLMAGWLADHGARRLVLAGRTPLPPRREWDGDLADADMWHRIAAIRDLERRGVSVDAVALDVGSSDQVQALLAKRDREGAPPIRGVIHAAGLTEGQLLTEIAETRLERTMWPKIAGARVLHEAFPPTSLDFCYLTASAGTVFGIAGQGAYAAGNAYLDCLARARHRQGGHTVSLDWVAWEGLGFGTDAHVVVQELARLGSRPIAPGEAFAAWEHVARYDLAQALMAPMHSSEEDAAAGADRAVRDWSTMSPADLHAELRHGLVGILAAELRTSQDEVAVDLPFAEMGLNSVMAMSIRREVERLVGLELSVTMLWNHPTIESFAGYLATQLAPADDASTDGDAGADSSVLDSLFDSIEST